MNYFKHNEDNFLYIDIYGNHFDSNLEYKLRISFDPKHILIVYIHDFDDNLIPVKKSSSLRKSIFNALLNKEWDKFIIDSTPIDGISNEEGELVEPLYALFPEKRKAMKINPYAKWNSLLIEKGLGTINDDSEIILRKKLNQELHIYYRKDSIIFHVCFDELDFTIVHYEIFSKTF